MSHFNFPGTHPLAIQIGLIKLPECEPSDPGERELVAVGGGGRGVCVAPFCGVGVCVGVQEEGESV